MKIFLNIVFIVICLLFAANLQAQQSEKILVKIGLIIPLSGAHSIYGEDAKNLTSFIAGDLSALSKKYKYEFVLEDGNCGVGNAASTATQKLVNIDGVKFIIYGCSGEVLQGAPIAAKAKTIAVSYAASHPDVSSLGEYVFRGYVDIRKGLKLIEEELRKDTTGKVGIITEESSFTAAIRDVLAEQLADRGVLAVDYQVDETDFKTGLLKLSAAGVSAIYINPNSPRTYINMFRQIKEFGIKVPLYSYYAPSDADALKVLGKSQDGIKFIDIYKPENKSQEFDRTLLKFFSLYPEGPKVPFLLMTSYNSILSLVTAIEAVGADPEKVKVQLISGSYIGASGPTGFDKNREAVGLRFEVKLIRDGKSVALN
ncbi:MAG: ABC transporter substrate-binding protein [Bdellovibrionota bacterium]